MMVLLERLSSSFSYAAAMSSAGTDFFFFFCYYGLKEGGAALHLHLYWLCSFALAGTASLTGSTPFFSPRLEL